MNHHDNLTKLIADMDKFAVAIDITNRMYGKQLDREPIETDNFADDLYQATYNNAAVMFISKLEVAWSHRKQTLEHLEFVANAY